MQLLPGQKRIHNNRLLPISKPPFHSGFEKGEAHVKFEKIMTCYIANHQKAKQVFTKRETQLLHALKHNLSRDKLIKAAELLREAQLKVFKAKFSQESVLPASSWQPNEEARHWMNLRVEEIIDKYRKKT